MVILSVVGKIGRMTTTSDAEEMEGIGGDLSRFRGLLFGYRTWTLVGWPCSCRSYYIILLTWRLRPALQTRYDRWRVRREGDVERGKGCLGWSTTALEDQGPEDPCQVSSVATLTE
jgi:hypothetical protein